MIRPATKNDISDLLKIAKVMHAESRYSVLEFSDSKVCEFFSGVIANHEFCCFVCEKDGVIIGGMAGFSMEHYASFDKVAGDFALFILPEHRGGSTAARLIKTFAAWAKETGAKLIHIGNTTGVNTEQTAALYEALGCRKIGYLFEVNNV